MQRGGCNQHAAQHRCGASIHEFLPMRVLARTNGYESDFQMITSRGDHRRQIVQDLRSVLRQVVSASYNDARGAWKAQRVRTAGPSHFRKLSPTAVIRVRADKVRSGWKAASHSRPIVYTGLKQPRMRRLGSNGISPETSKRSSSCIFASTASRVALSGHTCHEKTIFSPSFAATARRKSVCLPLGTLSSQEFDDLDASVFPEECRPVLGPFAIGLHLFLGHGNHESCDVHGSGCLG